MRNDASDGGWPGAPILNAIGTWSCAVVSVTRTVFKSGISGESFQVP